MFRRPARVPAPLADSPLAEFVPPDELRTLDQTGTRVRTTSGHTVMTESGAGRECLVVVEGSFAVRRGDRLVAVLGAGEFVGEGSLLGNRPRNATVTALEDSTVYAFNPREFSSLLSACPAIDSHVRAVDAARSLAA